MTIESSRSVLSIVYMGVFYSDSVCQIDMETDSLPDRYALSA